MGIKKMVEKIMKLFQSAKLKIFVLGGNIPKSATTDMSVDSFSDCKQLLYKLHSGRKSKYNVGMIYENGNKYPPKVLKNFIQSIDPTIKIVIYKNTKEFSDGLKALSLT
jgi:hypothetical protein